MPGPLVLRVPRTDVADDYVLVNTLHIGPSDLDLKLVATDGQFPFVASIQEKAIHKLQASTSQVESHHWQSILAHVLLQSPSNDPLVTGIEAVASLSSSSDLTIVIRNKISGITQRLGAITLKKDEDENIELFDWAGLAVSRTDALANQLSGLQTSVSEQQQEIAELKAQLDDLVEAKKNHEKELYRKFAALLNSKKLKIRDQQRLLAQAKVDPKAASQISHARSPSGHKPTTSRSSKRKAHHNINESETDDDDMGAVAFEDQENKTRQSSGGDLSTPERSDVDTDDDSDAGFAPAPVPSQPSRPIVNVASNKEGATKTTQPEDSNPMPEEPAMQSLPPRRQLPFSKKSEHVLPSQTVPKRSANVASNPSPAIEDDDETDDEL